MSFSPSAKVCSFCNRRISCAQVPWAKHSVVFVWWITTNGAFSRVSTKDGLRGGLAAHWWRLKILGQSIYKKAKKNESQRIYHDKNRKKLQFFTIFGINNGGDGCNEWQWSNHKKTKKTFFNHFTEVTVLGSGTRMSSNELRFYFSTSHVIISESHPIKPNSISSLMDK